MKATVLLISTYPELTTLARRYARHLNVPVEIYEGGISYGGHLYAKRREKDFEVFLSHGGTAAVIQQMLKKPVVEVKIHTSDLLQAYQRAASYGRPIVLMAYESEVMQQLEAVAGLFPDTPCRSLSYGSKEEYENIERKLGRLEGYTILGVGNCVRRIGEKNRCPYVQIVSQPDDVFEALSSARKILELGMREKTWNHRLSTIINCSNEGILVFDKEGRVILANTIAENQIDCDGPLAGKKASIPATPELVRLLYGDGKPLREGFVRTGGSDFFCNRLSVDVNGEKEELIVKFQRVRDIQSIELKARLQLVDKGLVARNTFESLIGDSPGRGSSAAPRSPCWWKGKPGLARNCLYRVSITRAHVPEGHSWRSTARPYPRVCLKANCSVTRAARSPAHAKAASPACSKWPTTALSFSTKSARSVGPYRRVCCVCFRSGKFCASVGIGSST